MIRLVDLSAFQPANEHWDAFVASGVRGVYVKASEGTGWRSPVYDAQVAGARAAGLAVGSYHFCHLGNVAAQLSLFQVASGMLGQNAGEMPPALDVERAPSPPDLATTTELLAAIEQSWGCLPVVYGGQDWLAKLGLDAHCMLWLSAYPVHLQHVWPADDEAWPELEPWKRPKLWQFSEEMEFSGVKVDASLFDGDAAAFDAFCSSSRV